MQKIASERDGWCLSENYINIKTHLKWKCGSYNHKWWATPYNIKNGHACKICGIQKMIKNR
ncbi:MAG: hypothetical protein CEE42_01285 [Promethearchaeota archaeon Loki_b31]|nr:MAG: hypothetical protein CEE42_01285 [Candidatus Lokiarchaeota archaeon Loki_b31]